MRERRSLPEPERILFEFGRNYLAFACWRRIPATHWHGGQITRATQILSRDELLDLVRGRG